MRNLFCQYLSKIKSNINRVIIISIGLGAFEWFLIRVIPKPSRAAYPCQRAAFPLASGFVLWITGILTSFFGIKQQKKLATNHSWIVAFFSLAIAILSVLWVTIIPTEAYRLI